MNKTYSILVSEPQNASESVEMTITGYISKDENNSAEFEAKLKELESKYKKITINVVNLYGGSTYQGVVIHDAIKDCKAETVTVTKGLSASMGVPISLAGDKVVMMKHSRLMMHRVQVMGAVGNSDDIKALAENIAQVETELVNIIHSRLEKGGVDKDTEWIRNNWFNKGDTYLSATQAKKAGLVDEVIEGEISKSVPKNMLTEPKAVVAFYEEQINPSINKTNEMKDVAILVSALKIANPKFEATEASQVASEITAQANQLKEANDKVKELESKLEKADEDKAKALVDSAQEANKITEAQNAHFLKMAKLDFDSIKAVLDGMTPHEPISGKFKGGEGKDPFAGFDFDKYQKEAPEELRRIKSEEPERYAELQNAYLGKRK